MKKFFKNLRDKKGSGIMTVMLAITFLTAFGTLALYLSYTSFQVSVSDRASKEVTLNAATCMDEIKAGLQDIVSDAVEKTYKDIMPNYISKGFDVQQEFSKKFFEHVASGANNDGDYLISINESNGSYTNCLYFPGSDEEGEPDIENPNTLYDLTAEHRGYDVRVTSTSGGHTGNIDILYDENDESDNPLPTGILLKGVRVTVTSNRLNRRSSVTADIKIGVPKIGYSLSPYTLAGIPEFVFICAKDLEQKGDGTSCTINGSAYAKNLILENSARMTVDKNSVMIVKDDISVNGYGYLTICRDSGHPKNETWLSNSEAIKHYTAGRFNVSENSTLWTGGIKIGDRSSVRLLGKTFVRNDLIFDGAESYAKIKGSYYGFGSSDTDPDNSSAIYSKGMNSHIDLDGLNQLTLSGTTFLTNESTFGAIDDLYNSGSEEPSGRIAHRTGESEYGHLDQLLYYAPFGSIEKREYRSDFPEQFASDGNLLYLKQNNGHIVVYYKNTGTYKYGVYKEDIDFDSIEDWSNPDDFLDWIEDEEFDPSTEDTDLEPGQSKMAVFTKEEFNRIYEFRLKSDYIEDLDKNFSDYGATLQPYYKWHNANEVVVYFFLKFDTQQHANQYFKDYFDAYVMSGKNTIKRNLDSYLVINGEPGMQSSVGIAYSNGNPVTGEADDFLETVNQLKQNAQVLQKMFYNYCKTLSNVDPDLSEEELNAISSPYDYYVNKSAINEFMPENSTKDEEYFYSNNKGVAVITNKGEFVYTGTGNQKDLCIILATGDVKVNADFKGLIICNGNITVGSTCTFTNNAINVVMSFASETTDLPEGENRQLKEFFNVDFTEIYTESVSGAGDAWNVAKLVEYETWTRE